MHVEGSLKIGVLAQQIQYFNQMDVGDQKMCSGVWSINVYDGYGEWGAVEGAIINYFKIYLWLTACVNSYWPGNICIFWVYNI